MSNKVFIIIGLIAVGGLALLFGILQQQHQEITPTPAYKQFEGFWAEYINEHSAPVAYELFKRSYEHSSPSDQHLVAHLFGGALYTALGVSGLPVCDMHFTSGCFHEFIGRALLEHGESVLFEFDRYCKESVYDCQHGIGHGLLGYYGYEYPNLLEALALCEKLGTTDVHDGCFGGIFMEYNVRSMLSGQGASMRTQDLGEPGDAVCLNVPEYARGACYFWIPQWFLAGESGTLDEKVFNATKKCQTISGVTERLTCYSGMTNELLSYTRDITWMSAYCDNPLLAAEDSLFRSQCRAGLASSLYMDPLTRTVAPRLCFPLGERERKYCEFFSTDAGGGKRIVPYTLWNESVTVAPISL